MTTASPRPSRSVNWYPRTWRERYGADFEQFLEDRYGGGPLPLSARLSMVRSGLLERLRSGGIVGSSVDPDTRVRGASLLVLCAWGVFIVAGSAFAKYTEHWPLATPPVDHWLPATAMAAVQAAAGVGVLILIMAGLACLPAFVHFIRSEGWRALWPLARPMVLSVIAAGVASAGIVAWNNRLGPSTTTPLGLRIAGVLAGLVVIAALAVSYATLIAFVYRLRISTRITRILGVLAVAMTLALAVIFAGALTWWISTALHAPWFFGSLTPRSPTSPAPLPMIVLGLMMLAGLVLAGVGAIRIATLRSAVGDMTSSTAS
ncbi:MAG TPA: hypothetical protein VFC03_10140 [Acidimicrobiales bacterium]|nr:hypothetical protein [Acidimicrobiales bacterium]